MQIHIHVQGRQQGPFALEKINQDILSGVLPPDGVMAWYEGCQAWIPLRLVPGIVVQSPYASPQANLGPERSPPPITEGDGTGGVIPYKNPQALVAYYLGIFGLVPCLGILFAIPAFILGILGLRARKRNPIIKGSVHAWIGIVLGGLSICGHLFAIVAAFMVGSPR